MRLSVSSSNPLAMTMEKNANSSLYQRLGGYAVIAAFVDDTYKMLRSDARFSRFAARSIDSQQRARQLACGPDMPPSRRAMPLHWAQHENVPRGLGITETEWQIALSTLARLSRIRALVSGSPTKVIAI